MIKKFNIPVKEKVQVFQVWLGAINWTLGTNQLTDSELEIFSYLLYYNDKYKSITEHDVRMDLLFSTTIKNKIKQEFNIATHKLETYLNKLRNKGFIVGNSVPERFLVYPENSIEVSFTCFMEVEKPAPKPKNPEPPVEQLPVEMPADIEPEITQVEQATQVDEYDDLDEVSDEPMDFRDPFDKYFNDEDTPLETWM
jgi:hypothetical protein